MRLTVGWFSQIGIQRRGILVLILGVVRRIPFREENMNESTEKMEEPVKENDALAASPYVGARTSSPITQQAGCPTCGGQGEPMDMSPNAAGLPTYVYSIGRVEARFPNLAAEKEFAQATGRTNTAGKPDQQIFHAFCPSARNVTWFA